MQVVEIILTILQVIASVALIVVVLLQSGKEAGLGAIAGSSDSYLGKNKNGSLDAILASSTKWIALAWLVLVLCLSFF
jgi:preprotein translocase subunit SecG